MRMTNRIMFAFLVCIVVVGAVCAFGQDWPQWRGVNRDSKVTGFKTPQTWPKELTQKWKVTVGEGCATPALVGDRLYVFTRQGNEEVIMCLNADTGDELWQDKYEAIVVEGGPSRGFTGPRSSPTVADGKVVTLGVGGVLSCLDASNGNVLWRKDNGAWPKFYTSMSPVIADGLCIAHLGKDGDGKVVAYTLAEGVEKWKLSGDGPSYSSPVLMVMDGTKLIVVLSDANIMGVGIADGKLLFQQPFIPQGRGLNVVTPIVEGQTIFYAGSARGTKAINIKKDGDNFVVEELWSNPDISIEFSTPVLKDGLLYGISDRSILYCIDARDGRTAWADDTTKRDRFGIVLDVGTVLLALAPQSPLVVFEPDEKEYKELASYKVSDSQVYACPVVAGNRIFIKDQDSVILWILE